MVLPQPSQVKVIRIGEDYNHPAYDRAELIVTYKPEAPKA
jgi:hypothetical protein